MILYQKAKTGKMKFIELSTESEFLCSKWGLMDSKTQESRKKCSPKNIGKVNETTASEQAIIEMQAKIKKKIKEGYRENINELRIDNKIDIDNIPEEFCPCKPISKCPDNILHDDKTYGQRKRDGNCIIFCKTESKRKIYSRRMQDITEHLIDLPVFSEMMEALPYGLILTEFCFVDSDGVDCTRSVGKVVRKKDKQKAKENYETLQKNGSFEIVPLDIMFQIVSGKLLFLGDYDYIYRYRILQNYLDMPKLYEDWKDLIPMAKELKWEGFVLRHPDKSEISYSMNGKPNRQGSYKFVFTQEDDFIVTSAVKGKAGRHAGLYASFNLSQYARDELIDCGKCGPGKLSHEELKRLTEDIDSGELKFPFVVQVEFKKRQESGKLEHPQLELIRYDKCVDECINDCVND